MEKKESKEGYSPFEMSTIMERMNALNTITAAKDYGTGEKFHTVEVHILSYIAEYPGVSVTEVARDWNRTKGAVSQIIKKLEGKGLVYREKEAGNNKKVCLYVTEEGARLDQAHRDYDTRNYKGFLQILQKHFSWEEIQDSFRLMEVWIDLSMEWDPS